MDKIIFTKDQGDLIKDMYLNIGHGTNFIADLFGVTQKVISRFLKENKIEIRHPTKKNTLNENSFKKIDEEWKAYFLGLLYGDGAILDKGKRQKRVEISLQEEDGYILECFSDFLEYSGNVRYYSRRNEPGREDSKTSAILYLSSDKLCNDLIEIGCVPRKSKVVKFPRDIIPNHLIKHFMRGLFDADGSVHSNNEHYSFDIYGTMDICLGFQEQLVYFLNLGRTKIIQRDGVCMMAYCGNYQLKNIYNFLYKDASIFLTRKQIKFEKVFFTKCNAKKFVEQQKYSDDLNPRIQNEFETLKLEC